MPTRPSDGAAGPGAGGPGGPHGPHQGGVSAPPRDPKRRGKVRRRRIAVILVLLLVLVLAWPVGLLIWANGQIQHVSALSDAADTPGTTYLLAGSDSREDSDLTDSTEGQRADTIMLLTAPESGTPSLISIPRDTFAEIPGYGANKLNSAYSFGGPELLVQTVESLTGITVDHFVEIGMGGVADVVDAVGGVELCLDYDVDDADSKLTWTAGCHMADGETALAFARMRHSDPLGDIGRTQRQQQVIQAVSAEVATPSLAVRPGDQVALLDAGLGALRVSEGTGIIDLGRMALNFRSTMSDGVHGTPPIGVMDYRPGGVGSTILLDEERAPGFWQAVADGTVTEDDLQEY
ncbi:MAG TPA: LCP family protein [Candidatus Ruania gallistercoris]|uniref:LCP family protein n=1 Tax=Candidatus Ruania gallistercoris TaxID=2838746 RepID=A0A9D2J307_9MICO|nr:LCP family protein [Candidatus Ruania gallistercoris]